MLLRYNDINIFFLILDPAENVKIELKTGNANVTFGDRFEFECKGGGKPAYIFTWKKNGKDIKDSKKIHGKYQQFFTVEKSTLEDAGKYTCHGFNYIGSIADSSNTIVIYVDSK